MIDSITVRLSKNDAWKTKNIKIEVKNGTLIGYVDNMRIVQKSDCIFVKGSLPKYHHGNNIQDVTTDDIMDCVKRFQSSTGLDLNNGLICSVEFGITLQMRESCSRYLELFGVPLNKTQVVYKKASGLESLRYESPKNTGGVELYIYDKNAECEASRIEIPKEYENENLLRIEYRIKNRKEIKRQFKKDLTVTDLCSCKIVEHLKNRLIESFRTIPMHNRIVYIDLKEKLNKNDVYRLLAEQYRQDNPIIVERLLHDLKKNNLMESKTFSRLKAELSKSNNDCRVSSPNALIDELNDKVSVFAEA